MGLAVEMDVRGRSEPEYSAACCRPFALSKQDIQEGIVKWDLGQPYINARDEEG